MSDTAAPERFRELLAMESGVETTELDQLWSRLDTVRAEDIDAFDHANNSVYLRWADQNAWAHWA